MMPTPTNEKDDASTPLPSKTPPLSTPKESEIEIKPPAPAEQHHPNPPSPYTLLTSPQRTLIALLAGLATMFSPLTANIYLPCLPLLQRDFTTTLQLMNLTVTGYVLIQGLSPTLFSQLSETLGRRPVYLLTFSIFAAASVALATIPASYPALLALRMLQSFGSSVSTSIGYAVVADIAAPAERGKIMAPVMMMMNLGPVVAPVIGGPMCGGAGWRWVFWFLAIFGSAFLLLTALFLPETNRKIVGNGSISAKGISRPPLRFLVPWSDRYEEPARPAYPTTWSEVRAFAPNPFKSVALVFQKDSACVLFAAGIFYMMYYVSQASLPALLKQAYGFSATEIGLCYLTLGLGVFFGSQIQARVMDWNYKVTAKKIGWEVDNVRGDNLSQFPIEQARARLSWVFHILQCSFALAYGWAIHFRLHPAVPLVFQFFQGLSGFVQSWNTLSVEIHRDSPSTASAAGNLTRCFLSAGGVAIMEPLMGVMGVGPFFTLLAGFCATVGISLAFTIRIKGMKWRLAREERQAARRR